MDVTDLLAECLAAQRRLASGMFARDEEAAEAALALIDAALRSLHGDERTAHALNHARSLAQAGQAKESLARLENVLSLMVTTR